jgi:prophage antirepressor-like protein
MGNVKRVRREKNVRADVVAESQWAPFVSSNRSAPLLTVDVGPSAESDDMKVRSHGRGARCYATTLTSFLNSYYLVHGEVEPVLHPSQPMVRTEPLPDMPRPGLVRLHEPLVTPEEAAAVPLPEAPAPLSESIVRAPYVPPHPVADYGHHVDPASLDHPVITPPPEPIAPAPEDLGVVVYVFRGRPCVVAAAVGRALGYADKVLAGLLRREWSAEIHDARDFTVLSMAEARAMLAESRVVDGPTLNPRGLMVLFETGFDLVLQKTDKPEGQKLRRRLADEVLPKLRRGEPVVPAAVAATQAPAGLIAADVEAMIDRRMAPVVDLTRAVAALVSRLGDPWALPAAQPAPAAVPQPVQVTAARPAAPTVLIPTDWLNITPLTALANALLQRAGQPQRITTSKAHALIREKTDVRQDPQLSRQAPSVRIDPVSGLRQENPEWWHHPSVADTLVRLVVEGHAAGKTNRTAKH